MKVVWPGAALDHLVVAAVDLDAGIRWCEATLGVTPGPGGSHPLMGTHNRLLRIDGPGFAQAYLEIIAIDSAAMPTRGPGLKRWFDLDDPALMTRLREEGPALIHWVARTPNLLEASQAWRKLGIDRGDVLSASRMTPHGLLQWHITVRDDGRRLYDGCLPTLIQWGAVHPAAQMPAMGLQLVSVDLQHPQAQGLGEALDVLGLRAEGRVDVATGDPRLRALIATPTGVVAIG